MTSKDFIRFACRSHLSIAGWTLSIALAYVYILGILKFGYTEVIEHHYVGHVQSNRIIIGRSGVTRNLDILTKDNRPRHVQVSITTETPTLYKEYGESLLKIYQGELLDINCYKITALNSYFWSQCTPWEITTQDGETLFKTSKEILGSDLIKINSQGYGFIAFLFLFFGIFMIFEILKFNGITKKITNMILGIDQKSD